MKDIMQYKDYIGSVHFSAEDGVFFGKIEGINDLITFEGTTVEEIEIAFKDAVEDYISICKQGGKSCKGSLIVRISPELHKKAVQESVLKGCILKYLFISIKTGYSWIISMLRRGRRHCL